MVTVKRRSERADAPLLTKDDVVARSRALNEPTWLLEKRLASWAVYEGLPMPTTADEVWRRTDYRSIAWEQASTPYATPTAALDAVPGLHLEPLIDDVQAALMVFVDGVLVQHDVPEVLKAQGVVFTDLQSAARDHTDLFQAHMMTRAVQPTDGKFAALHGAAWSYGVFVHVPRGVVAELPMHVVVYNTQQGYNDAHVLVHADVNSQATVLVDYASAPGSGHSAFVGATELLVEDAANLTFVALQDWDRQTYEFSHQRARVARDGQLDWISGMFGTRLLKAFMEIELDGLGAFGRMSGFFFADTDQLFDMDTQQNHNAPRTTSDLLFKGAARDRARTVWQGMIKSLPKMQKIDGFQASRNLVLSSDARMDGIPGLEIEADDVACSHAATFGGLQRDPIFYLMSRGIPQDEAELILIDGFFDELLARIPFERVRDRLQAAVEAKILKGRTRS